MEQIARNFNLMKPRQIGK